MGIQNQRLKQTPDVATLIGDFSQWATSWPRPVDLGASIVAEAIGSDQLCIDIKPVDDSPQTFHFCNIPQETPEKQNEDETYRNQILENIIESGRTIDVTNIGAGYLLSSVISLQMPKGHFILSAFFNNKPNLTVEQSTFFQVAAPQLAQEISRSYRKRTAVEIAEEAIEAIEESIIIYDKEDRVMMHNSQYRELFPSVADMLRQGVRYDDLLREQARKNPLYKKYGTVDNWIKFRKKQLHEHGYQEEQGFIDGQTLRLTNYRLKSGGTISIRNNITELVHARQKAENNEKLFRMLLEGAPVPLSITSGQRIMFANQIFYDLLKAEEGSLIGTETKTFFDDMDAHAEVSEILNNTGRLRNHLVEMKDCEGNRLHIALTGTPIEYEGQPSLFYALVDVTENVENREALQKSELKNRTILELIPDAIVVQSEGRIAYANAGAAKIFGVDNEAELMGTNNLTLVPEHFKENILAHRTKVLETKLPAHLNSLHMRKNGEVFHSELHTSWINWEGVPSTLNIVKDVSRRHQYEEQLKTNEQEMTLAQHIGNFGHWRHNLIDNTVIWSKTLYDLHDVDYDVEITPDFFKDMILPSTLDHMNAVAGKAIDTGEAQPYEIELKGKNGEIRTISGSILAEYDESGNPVSLFGVSEDITDRRELEQKFRQSQKMEAVGQLTGGVAHDFNNLLAIILGNSELLEESFTSSQSEQKQCADNIIRAATRGADLVNSMLAFSRTQELRPVHASLRDLIVNMIDVLRRTIGENIQLSANISDDLWPCIVDVGQVENALLNLSLNARDAMPEGGDICIELSNENLTAGLDSMGEEYASGKYVKLCVCDSGTGIPEEKIQKVFDPFYTTKEVGKGTGLGLSMVYGFIKQSKGHVMIHSDIGKGTRVELFLPKGEEDKSSPPQFDFSKL